jgi:hypothetical protein
MSRIVGNGNRVGRQVCAECRRPRSQRLAPASEGTQSTWPMALDTSRPNKRNGEPLGSPSVYFLKPAPELLLPTVRAAAVGSSASLIQAKSAAGV